MRNHRTFIISGNVQSGLVFRRPSRLVTVALSLVVSLVACKDGGQDGLGLLPPGLFGPPPRDIDRDLFDALNRAGILPNAGTAPAGDETNSELVALGRALFFDPVLSGDRNISCATCHLPASGTGDSLPVSIGAGGNGSAGLRALGAGAFIARNAPPLYSLGGPAGRRLFWDGRVERDPVTGVLQTPEPGLNGSAPALAAITAHLTSAAAAQALFPVASDDEMRGQPGNEIRDAADNATVWSLLMARLVGTSNGTIGGTVGYRALFAAAFPDAVNYDDLTFGHAGRAIAAFERAAFRPGGPTPKTFSPSPFDRYVNGDLAALSFEEKRGALVFLGRRGGCARCHRSPALSDFGFHSIAAPQIGPGAGGESGEDRGRALVTSDSADNYRFRTPSLRNVELTAPYTHSGAYASLEAVILHYGDPAAGIRNYNPGQLRADFAATADANSGRMEARIAALSPELRGPPPRFNPDEVREMVVFLKSLTDPAARAATGIVPSATASGLPFAH